jgi:hypothetical protein
MMIRSCHRCNGRLDPPNPALHELQCPHCEEFTMAPVPRETIDFSVSELKEIAE